MTRPSTNQSGYAVLLVMMVMMVLFLLGTVMLTVAGNSRKDSIRQREQMQAYYTAEAGVEKTLAMAAVRNDWDWFIRLPDMGIGLPYYYLQNKSYPDDESGGKISYVTIYKQKNGNDYFMVIESKGQLGNNNRTLIVKAQVIQNIGGGNGYEIFITSWSEKYGVF